MGVDNKVDITVDIYEDTNIPNFRHRVKDNPDFPDTLDIYYQEYEAGNYVTKASLENIDKELWAKLVAAGDLVFKGCKENV